MTSPLPANTSQTARLMADPPGFAVGWQEPLYLPAPAAGQNWSHVVDGRYYERLVAARFTFTADAVVATRAVQVRLMDVNGVVVLVVPVSGGVTAGGSVSVNAVTGAPATGAAVSGDVVAFIPGLLIPPDWSWSSHVVAMDAGDQVSNAVLLVQRFPNDAVAVTAG